MATIKSKKKPVIKKGAGFIYVPETFYEEHHVPQFEEVDDPQIILDNVKPMEFIGRRFISFDTETHPYYKSSADVPKGVVRRWVGSGKKATPQDYPFSLQVCDGTHAWTIYDSYENGFKKFKALAPLFEDPTVEKIAHNVKYDMHMLHNVGMKIIGKIHDTVVLCKIENENQMSFELKALAAKHQNGIVKFEYMVDTYKQLNKINDYRDIPRPLLSEYGCADVWNCINVFKDTYTSMLEQDKHSPAGKTLEGTYEREMGITIVYYEMERVGMRVDIDYEKPLKEELSKLVQTSEQAVYDMAGCVFNMNSTKQLYTVLINMGVDSSIIKFTEKGNPCFDKNEMERLDEVYHIPLISEIQKYKKAEKLLTTYAIGIYDQVDSEGFVHGSINQTEASTGRSSITKPALQTLPKKDKRIRRAFIPGIDESKLWFIDLDQVEYRGFSHYAQAAGLIEAINNGYDIHTATAALIFNLPIEEVKHGITRHTELEYEKKKLLLDEEDTTEVDKELAQYQRYVDMRVKGKTINFALIYGVGNDHLAELLGVTTTEAAAIRAKYFAAIPEARRFIETVYAVIKQRGYTVNFYGRRRRLDVDDAYKAPNALIQGWAADYIKSKILDMYKFIKYNGLKTVMRNVVHDEDILDVPNDEEHYVPTFRWLLSDFDTYRCKITAGVEYGDPSWGQKKEPLEDIGFKAPDNFDYRNYDVYNGKVFDI